MNSEDFLKLHIGETVWVRGENRVVMSLCSEYEDYRVKFYTTLGDPLAAKFEVWEYIRENCSLVPPSRKKRYWQWKIKKEFNCWYRHDNYLNDDGMTSSGTRSASWHEAENRIKIEDDFVDA